jgi:hypothetical protein
MAGVMTARTRTAGGGDGFATVAVVIAAAVVCLFVLTLLGYALQDASRGRRDQDGKIALAAAQSALEDYASRLNADPSYWTKGNVDSANPALGPAGSRPVASTDRTAGYRYEVLSAQDAIARAGVVRVRATGWSSAGPGAPRATRTLTATLRSRSFLEYAYFSDIEVMDPQLVGSDARCASYAYGPLSRLDLSCPTIIWKAGDQVDGAVHSNDAFTIDSAVTFRSPKVESSWPQIEGAGPSDPTWLGRATSLDGYKPTYAAGLSMPEANNQLTEYVDPNPSGGASGPGCYYTGNTRIVFDGAVMHVFSPSTSDPATPDRCLTVSTRDIEQTKPIPPLIYVAPTDDPSCTQGAVGYPMAGETFTTGGPDDAAWGHTTNYDCHRGTVYVQGRVDSRVTVAAAHDVVVTGDLTLADGGTGDDVVGLVGGTYVWVYHPIDTSAQNLAGAPVVRQIQAAVLSLGHSFVVQNWSQGQPLGNLELLGALAQKMRGPVGATDPATGRIAGYLKAYRYDSRFSSIQPPYFLKPGTNQWRVQDVTDS